MRDNWSLEDDLSEILEGVGEDWRALSGANLFITGGTGFIGRWMLQGLMHANRHLKLGVRATILTRNRENFRQNYKEIYEAEGFQFCEGDVKTFEFPREKYTHIIHAATDASADLNQNNPLQMYDTVLEGTRRVLEFAVDRQVARVLYLSSGAVYGQQPWDLPNIKEDWRGSPDCLKPLNTYAEAKRAAEMLCAIYGQQFGLNFSSARIFALLGPYLSLDTHFAAGNFIRDAMSGKKITVQSSGLAVRSYLYASDLTIMLWGLLVRGEAGKAYNVGSDEPISIKDLAQRVAGLLGQAGFEICGAADQGWNPGRYVPDVSLLQTDLGISRRTSLDQSILRTAIWNGWKPWRS